MARFKILDLNNFIKLGVLVLLLASFSAAETFPKNISTGDYYYRLFIANFKTKMDLLHSSFPHRVLVNGYWQYAASGVCDTLYSHAYIPRLEVSEEKITIEISITECGQVIHGYTLELYLQPSFKPTPDFILAMKKELLRFNFPDLDFEKYSQLKMSLKNCLLEWRQTSNEIIFLFKSYFAYSYLEIELKQFSSSRENTVTHHLKTSFLQYKNDSLVNSKILFVSYQPPQENLFPAIQYFDENKSNISSLKYFDSYEHYISSTLNELILELTNINEKHFNVKPTIILKN